MHFNDSSNTFCRDPVDLKLPDLIYVSGPVFFCQLTKSIFFIF